MRRKHLPLLLLTLAVACFGAALAAGFPVADDTATDLLARDKAEGDPPVRIAGPRSEPTPKADDVVCPGVILKVGPAVELPCRRGAEIVKATSVEIDGAYCAKVTYIAETGSPPRTETLCEGEVPSVGGGPVTGPSTAERREREADD